MELNRDLVCIQFPGIVKNDTRALQCLGGIRNISQVYSQTSKKRLGLSFQPENHFIKKIYADTQKASGVVIKVTVKNSRCDGEIKREVLSTTVLGCVKKIYRFESICDFQYLPVHREGPSSSQMQCILEKILPSGMDSLQFMSEPAPLYLVPSNFTRFDKPTCYYYTQKRYYNNKVESSDDLHLMRKDRMRPSNRHSFTLVGDLVTGPDSFYIRKYASKLKINPKIQEFYDIVKKLFDDRPIWSLNLIRYRTKIRLATLKIVTPCLAFHYKDGPWRLLWVRYGYDPRIEPGARIYQSLDFRLRNTAGVNSMVMLRDQSVFKTPDRVRSATRRRSDDTLQTEDITEGVVCFRPGMVPAQRQIFYQYCDVEIPEVAKILANEPPPGYLCHQKLGWLPPNTDRVCRDHIFRYVKQTLLANYSSDSKLEQASSDDESIGNIEEGELPSLEDEIKSEMDR